MPVSERIALVAPSTMSVVRNRDDLILDLVRKGHRVMCFTPAGSARDMRMLRHLHAQHHDVDIGTAGIPFLPDFQTVGKLTDAFRDWQPTIVLNFGARACGIGAIAAGKSDIPRIISFVNEPVARSSVIDNTTQHLKQGLEASERIFAHNSDIVEQLLDLGLIDTPNKTTIIPGAGVNVGRQQAQQLPTVDNGIIFLMVAGLDRARGVIDYAKAAKELNKKQPRTRFLLAGPEVETSTAVAPAYVDRKSSGIVEYLGDLENVRPALAQSHVFVYPSYREGMPRAVLEALANGRPVITTNSPGCRETVDERVSGVLIEPGNVTQLVRAMQSFIDQAGAIPIMCRAARQKAERRFNAADVTKTILDTLEL